MSIENQNFGRDYSSEEEAAIFQAILNSKPEKPAAPVSAATPTEIAQQIKDWCLRSGNETFKISTVQREFSDIPNEDIKKAIDKLEESGWIALREKPRGKYCITRPSKKVLYPDQYESIPAAWHPSMLVMGKIIGLIEKLGWKKFSLADIHFAMPDMDIVRIDAAIAHLETLGIIEADYRRFEAGVYKVVRL